MAKITWVAPNAGTWTTLGNWSPAQIPGAADDVLFDGSGADLSFVATSTVANLTLNDPTTLLTVTGGLSVANNLAISSGTLAVSGNATATLNNFTNQGTITIASTGTVVASGSYNADSVERIGGSRGVLRLLGTMDNAGGTFTLPGSQAVKLDQLGTIHGGTIVGDYQIPYSDQFFVTALDNVEWQGGLRVRTGGSSADEPDRVNINNGFVIRAEDGVSPGTLTLDSGIVSFHGDQTLDNAIVRVVSQSMAHNIFRSENTLTLGAGTKILLDDDAGGTYEQHIKLNGVDTNSAIFNFGTIDARPTSKVAVVSAITTRVHRFENSGVISSTSSLGVYSYIWIESAIFKNTSGGTISATMVAGNNMEILVPQATDFTNDGTISMNGGSIDIDPLLQGSGIVTVQGKGTVDLNLGATQGQTIAFIDSGVLELGTPALFAGTITGVTKVTRIDLAVAAKAIAYTNNHLTMQLGGGQTFNLNIVGENLTLSNFVVNTGAATTSISTDVPAPCFAAGTRIATDVGDVMVEDLNIGDNVLTEPDAAPQSIVWIGKRLVDCRHHPDPRKVWPVRIAAGAFAPNQPTRDLFLSPDHAVFVDDVLIPVKYLINGGNIAQIEVNEVEYYHIELAHHDIIVAEGLPVESYLDTGDRASFANGGAAMDLFPVFGSGVGLEILREACSRAPLVIVGAVVEGVRRRLDRARTSKRKRVAAR